MVSLIVAHDLNGIIGNGPDIPWHLPADFKRFKEITMGHPVIMGRTTFESIGKPLPGRLNIIVTRGADYEGPEGTLVATSVEEAIKLGEQEDQEEVFVLGGSQIYRYALEHDLVDKAYITRVATEVEGDIFFPRDYMSRFALTDFEHRDADEKNKFDMDFLQYEKSPLVHGKVLAERLEHELELRVRKLANTPRLGIYVIGDDEATKTYVSKKRALAERAEIEFIEYSFQSDVTQEDLEGHLQEHQKALDGVVVQLPLPAHINREVLFSKIDPDKDPDMLNEFTFSRFVEGDRSIFPPVVASIDEILNNRMISIENKKVLIIGTGKLVGGPAAVYFKQEGGVVTTADKETSNLADKAKDADIIVSGAGVSDLVKLEMIKEGVVLLDGGTSGSSGALRGDIDWNCEQKAKLFARSPGGIGPLTVVSLFQNLVTLIKNKQ